MSQNRNKEIAEVIAALIAAGLIADGQLIELKEGQSIDEALEEIGIEHRKECEECRSAYEAEQAEAKKAADELLSAAKKGEPVARDNCIGYMAFHVLGGRPPVPFPGSFAINKEDVETSLDKFKQTKIVKLLLEMGLPLSVQILPVYL